MNLEELVEEIGGIKEPETGVSIKELGIIDRVEIKDAKVVVHVNFSYMVPSCKACIPIHWMVTRSVVRKMERVLKKSGLKYRIVESRVGTVYAEE